MIFVTCFEVHKFFCSLLITIIFLHTYWGSCKYITLHNKVPPLLLYFSTFAIPHNFNHQQEHALWTAFLYQLVHAMQERRTQNQCRLLVVISGRIATITGSPFGIWFWKSYCRKYFSRGEKNDDLLTLFYFDSHMYCMINISWVNNALSMVFA